MADPETPPLDQAALLAALAAGWEQFVPRWAALTPTDQAAYLQAQGYTRLQDLLAHLCGWMAEGMQVVQEILEERRTPRKYDIDAFNAESMARYQDRSAAEVEAEFVRLIADLRQQLEALPPAALANKRIYRWLDINIIEHYDEHRLPNAPALASHTPATT